MLDFAFRKGFPIEEYNRVKETIRENAKSAKASSAFLGKAKAKRTPRLVTRYSTGIENYEQINDQDQVENDLKNIDRYVRVWSRLFRMFNPSCDVPMSMEDSVYAATERCFNVTPYGRRYAVNTLCRDAGNHPLLPEPGGLPVFKPYDQTELARALDTHLKRRTTLKLKVAGWKTGRIQPASKENSSD